MKKWHPIEAISSFQRGLEAARAAFRPGDNISWLTFYNRKMELYSRLAKDLPPVKDIDEFWRIAQYLSAKDVGPWIDREVKKILASAKCADCGIWVDWPSKVCDNCVEVRIEAKRKLKEQNKAP